MRILVLLLSLIPSVVLSQVSCDFESLIPEGWIFDRESSWGLDVQDPISGTFSLRHKYDNPESGSDIACLPIRGIVTDSLITWKFKIRHGYNPSSSNKWSVILASNEIPQKELDGGCTSGFLLGVNQTGYDDTLRLVRRQGGAIETVAETSINWQEDIGTNLAPGLTVKRYHGGRWEIFISYDASSPLLAGSGFDNSPLEAEYFGLYYSYTSSCDRLLWLDDVYIDGYFKEDTTGPVISRAEFVSSTTIKLSFDEPVKTELISPDNFRIQPGGVLPDRVRIINPGTIFLESDSTFQNKEYYLAEALDIFDLSGNCTSSTKYELALVIPEWGDIVITELLADPDPAVDLPLPEYIEIYNRSHFPINLRSLSIVNGDLSSDLPEYLLEAGSYITVCDEDDMVLVNGRFPVLSLKSMPSLNNREDLVLVCDTSSGTLHGLSYDESWRNNHFKNDGGWSFEMIDPSFPFAGAVNWKYSEDSSGGTPGRINSVNNYRPDAICPFVASCYPLSDSSLTVNFSEPVTDLQAVSGCIFIDGEEPLQICRLDSLHSKYKIILASRMSEGVLYTIDLISIYDYAANVLYPSFCSTGLFSVPSRGDLVINEILFDPLPGESEFIEFYNRSDKIIDASKLNISCINTQSGDTGSVTCLAEEPISILPGSYFAVCEEKASLLDCYFSCEPHNIYEPGNLTSLPDDRGRVLLLRKDLLQVDDFSYSGEYHSDMLSSSEGVSLERISPDIQTNNESNWHSASGLSGWATPGMKNSVFNETKTSTESSVSLSSKRITPDNDGYEDYLLIKFNLEEGEWIIDVRIYNDQGYRVNTLCDNLSAWGTESLVWQATDAGGNILPSGLYIVYIKAVSASATVLRWKRVCSVLRR